MGFTKYQKTEKTEVVSRVGHRQIGAALRKQGKTSLSEVSEKERAKITGSLDKQ
jgi:hypothetical protein